MNSQKLFLRGFCDSLLVASSMADYAEPCGFEKIPRCLADILPGEFKEGYMDVDCLRPGGKTPVGDGTATSQERCFLTVNFRTTSVARKGAYVPFLVARKLV